ncbi:hypothetical protein HAX54_013637 [Datura stramonium]|uniref:Uncharacterized protein n=1 Tax=Datura stramonium TaxID=4076 RepID=A0ABS8TMI0_DATST|nr:hypothetical protein [Datura stramonium]
MFIAHSTINIHSSPDVKGGCLPGHGGSSGMPQTKLRGVQGSGQWERSFRLEVDLLSRLHFYLVELGYRGTKHHRLLIFDYMPNELLTGRVPIDTKRPPGEHVLSRWALPRLTNREKVVEMVAAIAAMCVQTEADYRPLMTDVVQSLVLCEGILFCMPLPIPSDVTRPRAQGLRSLLESI